MNEDARWMRQAIRRAQRAAAINEVPIGAVVVREGKIIASGFNTRETNDDPTGHAEITALKRAAKRVGDWRLNDCTLYVTLEPCPMCAGAIVNARIRRLVYGATDPKMGAVHTLYQICNDTRLNHHVNVTPGILADECGVLLREFFAGKRKANRKKP